MQNETFC